jgi:predicted nucleic acid-binding protein
MTAERFTLDTNILVYSIDSEADIRGPVARRIIDLAIERDCWLTLQAISEFYSAGGGCRAGGRLAGVVP